MSLQVLEGEEGGGGRVLLLNNKLKFKFISLAWEKIILMTVIQEGLFAIFLFCSRNSKLFSSLQCVHRKYLISQI